MSVATSFIGKVLDNYRILENLGVGGMGVVFKAIHIKLDKVFALKMIAPALVMNENFIKRFQVEAKSLAKLEDPNIVRIYDLRSHNDQWFIVMEYVDGINLQDKIKNEGPLDWQQALPILRQILNAINHAHAAGIIHRDIKPNNVMITSDGLIKITDFGLAKDQSSLSNKQTAATGGTLYYMSPEQIRGLSDIDQRSDIYSTGMTFYEMITGNVPFEGITSDFEIRETIVKKKLKKPSTFTSGIPSGLEDIVMKAISKKREDRFQTAAEMLQAVEDFIGKYNFSEEQKSEKRKTGSSSALLKSRFKDFGVRIYIPEVIYKFISWRNIIFAAAGILLLFLSYVLFYPDHHINSTVGDIEKTLAHLSISTSPDQATILLNGDSVGQSELVSMAIAPDIYRLQLSKTNYHGIDTSITLNPGNHLSLRFSLQKDIIPEDSIAAAPVKNQVTQKILVSQPVVTIYSEPPNAILWINDQLKGTTPCRVQDLKNGWYKMRLEKDGYMIYQNNVQVTQQKSQIVSAKLIPLTGILSIKTDPDSAAIFIDGKEMGENYTLFFSDTLPVGHHQIDIKKSGYASISQLILIRPDSLSLLNFKLQKLEGNLILQIRPWGSVYINGELKESSADTRTEFILTQGAYTLKVAHPTLGRWQKDITIEPENTTNILIDFNREFNLVVSAFDENGNPVNGTIFLDNQNTGKITPHTLNVKTGLHKLDVKKDGFISIYGEKEINIDQNLKEPQKFILRKLVEKIN
jgi:serine/threonine protein kinase